MKTEIIVYIIVLLLASMTFAFGLYSKKRVKEMGDSVKSDTSYIRNMKKSNFIMTLGLILIYTVIAILVLPVVLAYLGFAIMVLYIIAYSMHMSTGTSYKDIMKILLIAVIIVLVSGYLVNKYS